VCGNTQFENVKKHFPSVEKIKQHSKGRYFAFRGCKWAQKDHLSAIEHLVKPYPKRNEQQ
jgi:hypothetical protein